MTRDLYTLPPNLPVPEDDGAAAHLPGTMLPQLTLESSQGPVWPPLPNSPRSRSACRRRNSTPPGSTN